MGGVSLQLFSWRQLFRLIWPLLVEQLLTVLVGMVDEGIAASFAEAREKAQAAAERERETKAAALDGVEVPDVPYEEMTVEQLQAAILAKMAANGPVTDQMRRDVEQNVWPGSLVNWVKSFR